MTDPLPVNIGDVVFTKCPHCKVDTFAGVAAIDGKEIVLECYNALHDNWREEVQDGS